MSSSFPLSCFGHALNWLFALECLQFGEVLLTFLGHRVLPQSGFGCWPHSLGLHGWIWSWGDPYQHSSWSFLHCVPRGGATILFFLSVSQVGWVVIWLRSLFSVLGAVWVKITLTCYWVFFISSLFPCSVITTCTWLPLSLGVPLLSATNTLYSRGLAMVCHWTRPLVSASWRAAR